MINDIPSCCKISLKGYDAPLTILISYLGGAFAGKHRDATDGGHSMSDLKVFVSQKHTEPSPSANEGVYNNVSGFRLSLPNVAQENCDPRREGFIFLCPPKPVSHFLFNQWLSDSSYFNLL